jgi:uncharacterized protein YabE (DUF348 family)
VKRLPDPTLAKGKREVEEYGQPSRSTSVTRVVYAPNGKVRSRTTWYSSYRAEPEVLRVGTKTSAKDKGKEKDKAERPGTTTTTPDTSPGATTTTPASSVPR